MRVLCRSGHFAFYPMDDVDLVRFQDYFDVELLPEDDYYTFAALVGLPRFSLALLPYLNLPAVVTYEGRHAWDVMRENGFVYDVTAGVLVPVEAVTSMVKLPATNYFALSQTGRPLIQPGAILLTGARVLSYDGEFRQDWQQLRLRSVGDE